MSHSHHKFLAPQLSHSASINFAASLIYARQMRMESDGVAVQTNRITNVGRPPESVEFNLSIQRSLHHECAINIAISSLWHIWFLISVFTADGPAVANIPFRYLWRCICIINSIDFLDWWYVLSASPANGFKCVFAFRDEQQLLYARLRLNWAAIT